MTERNARLLYAALLGHDGSSMRPEWKKENQDALTRTLDVLRGDLYQVLEKPFHAAELDEF